jgi:transposase-like protein
MAAEEIAPRLKVEAPDCPACGALMEVVATVAKSGGMPELQTFKCEVCAEVITKEVEG